PELLDELHGLTEAAEPFAGLRPLRGGEWRLVHGLAAADAQKHATRNGARDGGHGLRDDRRVVAEGGGHHAGAQTGSRRSRRGRTKPGERKGRVPAGIAPRMEVVAYGNAVVA